MKRLVSGVVFHEGRVLLVRRAGGEILGGRWTLPEGSIDRGDGWIPALVEAIHRETGLLVNVLERTATPYLAGPWPGVRAIAIPIAAAPKVKLADRLETHRWILLRDLSDVEGLVPGLAEEVVMALEAGFYGVV